MIDQILSPTLGDLEFDALSRLLHWDSALLYGAGDPIVGSKPTTIKEKDLQDFGYSYPRQTPSPFPDRSQSTASAPTATLEELRELIVDPSQVKQESGPTRPNEQAAFDLLQDQRVGNPLLQEWEIVSVESNFYEPPMPNEDAILHGVDWALSSLALQLVGRRVMAFEVVKTLGAAGAIAVHRAFLDNPALIEEFYDRDVERCLTAGHAKIQRAAQQQHRWADMTLIPVMNPDGQIDAPLTAANVATCLVVIQSLEKLKASIGGFMLGAEMFWSNGGE